MDAEPEEGAEPYTSSEVDVGEIRAGPEGGYHEESAVASRDPKALPCIPKVCGGK